MRASREGRPALVPRSLSCPMFALGLFGRDEVRVAGPGRGHECAHPSGFATTMHIPASVCRRIHATGTHRSRAGRIFAPPEAGTFARRVTGSPGTSSPRDHAWLPRGFAGYAWREHAQRSHPNIAQAIHSHNGRSHSCEFASGAPQKIHPSEYPPSDVSCGLAREPRARFNGLLTFTSTWSLPQDDNSNALRSDTRCHSQRPIDPAAVEPRWQAALYGCASLRN